MKVLVINGSPKCEQSNTLKLTNSFLRGMEEHYKSINTEFLIDKIDVNKADIKSCLGCFSCWNKTPGICCIKDDMKTVIQKILWADITIWSFPLYYFGVPGKMKMLIDRQIPMSLPFMEEHEGNVGNGSHPPRYDLSNKKTVLISTCGFYTAENNYDSVLSMFDHICGKNNYTHIFCGQGELFKIAELSNRTDEYLDYVYNAGKEYAVGNISNETYKNLNQLLYSKEVFETMADASWGINKNGELESEALIFTKQMAALYNKNSYKGKDFILIMDYTDIGESYQIILGRDGSEVLTESTENFTTKIETDFTLWKKISSGEISGQEAMMKQMYRVYGDFSILIEWGKYFGGV